MGERLTASPEPESAPAIKLHDVRYAYRGYHTDDGITRVRVYDRPADVPLVIAIELPENTNTSITNMAEYLAWEVGRRYLPDRFEHERPFEWVEHYPGDPCHPIRHRREDSFSLALFEDYRPRIVWLGGHQRVRIGLPTWKHLSDDELTLLLGIPLETDEPR